MKEKQKQTLLATRKRRKGQDCRTFEVKLDKSHLSKEKKSHLNRLFLEAKWLYNSILSSEDVFKYDTKIKEVFILNKDREKEIRELKSISSQMKQGIKKRTIRSIKTLSTLKKKGKSKRVGKLKFKSEINSIPLNQHNYTHKIKNGKYLRLQKFKKQFKIIGFNQIPTDVEFANANLIRKAGDYYLHIITFSAKVEREKTGKVIGLDFGIKDNIIDSNGEKHNYNFPETRQIKKASKKVNRARKGSRNRFKLRIRLQKAYNNNDNRKKDTKNKFVSSLKQNYDFICIQDETISGWKSSKMRGFGRKVQHSIMGGIISELKKHSETLVVDRFFPSTKLCPECKILNKPTLEDRIYTCNCGYSQDRDTHSARNILREGLKQIGEGLINPMPAEEMLDRKDLSGRQFPMMQEALIEISQ